MVRNVSTVSTVEAVSGSWTGSAICDSLWEMLRISVFLETSGEETSIGPFPFRVIFRVNVDECPLEGDVDTPTGGGASGGEYGKGYKVPDWES